MEFAEIETGNDLAFSNLGPLAMKLQGSMKMRDGHKPVKETMSNKELIKIK